MAAIGDEFQQERVSGIGGSDIGPLLGVSRFADVNDVWLAKTRPQPAMPETVDLRRGRLLEPLARQRYKVETGRAVQRVGLRRHSRHKHRIVHLDGRIVGAAPQAGRTTAGAAEFKAPRASTMRRVMEDGLFPSWWLQLQWGMHVTGYNWGSIGLLSLEAEPDWLTLDFDYDPATMGSVAELVDLFWNRHVLELVPPDPVEWVRYGEELGVPRPAVHGDAVPVLTDSQFQAVAREYAEAHALHAEASALLDERKEAVRGALAALGLEAAETDAGRFHHKWQEGRHTLDRQKVEAARLLDYAKVVDWLAGAWPEHWVEYDIDEVLEELLLDLTVLEKVGQPFRTLRFYPKQEG